MKKQSKKEKNWRKQQRKIGSTKLTTKNPKIRDAKRQTELEKKSKNQDQIEKKTTGKASAIRKLFDEQKKKDKKEKKQFEKILKNLELLIMIVEEVHKRGVEGEEDTILVLTNKINLRLVKGCDPTSGNMLVSDETGGGKDAVTKPVCKILVPAEKLIHRTDVSERALVYWATNKPKGFSWDECVLYLEDPEENLIKCQTFRVMASGNNISSVVKDQKLIDLFIPGKPVMIITSLKARIDVEGLRRWDAVRVDLSEKLTRKVIVEKLKKQTINSNKIIKDNVLTKALQSLESQEVIIPFALELAGYLPNTLVMRTQVNKLIDYIKSSAILHQHQREKDEKGRIIATWFDYDYARFIFKKLRDVEGGALNKDEEKLVQVLREADAPLSIKEISEKLSTHGKKWLYEHLEEFKEKGLIKETSGWDERANKDILKIYTDFSYSSVKLPKSSVFTGCNSKSDNQNKEGCHGCHGFYNILEKIDNMRKKRGLNLLLRKKPLKPQNLSVYVCHQGGENLDKTTLSDRITELKEYCEKVTSSGNIVTYENLCFNFDKPFIEKCKEKKILISNPKGSYVFGG